MTLFWKKLVVYGAYGYTKKVCCFQAAESDTDISFLQNFEKACY